MAQIKPYEYRKIMLSGKQLMVICVKFKEVDGEIIERIPSLAEKFLDKDGCEFLPASSDDFLEDYARRNGEPVSVDA